MDLKEFQDLPIGTVLIYKSRIAESIEIKTSKNITRYVYYHNYHAKIIWGHQWEYVDYRYFEEYLMFLKIAPKWIADKFKVL